MFQADRRAADRRRDARPEDRAGKMRTRGAHRDQEVHAERFPFPTNPTSRLTARTDSLLRGIPFMPTSAEVWRRVFAPASLAGFLPAIGSYISFSPAAAFFGLLGPGFDTPTQRVRQVGDVAGERLLLRCNRFAGALLIDEIDQSGLVVVLELARVRSNLTSGSRCAWQDRACPSSV